MCSFVCSFNVQTVSMAGISACNTHQERVFVVLYKYAVQSDDLASPLVIRISAIIVSAGSNIALGVATDDGAMNEGVSNGKVMNDGVSNDGRMSLEGY
jgi:hypothetical protein